MGLLAILTPCGYSQGASGYEAVASFSMCSTIVLI